MPISLSVGFKSFLETFDPRLTPVRFSATPWLIGFAIKNDCGRADWPPIR
jgi:hypothetical protein